MQKMESNDSAAPKVQHDTTIYISCDIVRIVFVVNLNTHVVDTGVGLHFNFCGMARKK